MNNTIEQQVLKELYKLDGWGKMHKKEKLYRYSKNNQKYFHILCDKLNCVYDSKNDLYHLIGSLIDILYEDYKESKILYVYVYVNNYKIKLGTNYKNVLFTLSKMDIANLIKGVQPGFNRFDTVNAYLNKILPKL